MRKKEREGERGRERETDRERQKQTDTEESIGEGKRRVQG